MDQKLPQAWNIATLGQIGLQESAPYLMNRIMGRYNATLRDDYTSTTSPPPRCGRSPCCGPRRLRSACSPLTVIEESSLSRTLDALEAQGLVGASSARPTAACDMYSH